MSRTAINNMIEIKPATEKDLPALSVLEKGNSSLSYSDGILKELLEGDSVFLAAWKQGEIIGYVAASVIFEDSDIVNIVVDNNLRRCGVGKLLMQEVVKKSKNLGARRVLLEVAEDNLPALGLYYGLGFERISVRYKYYGDKSAIIMQLLLCD